MTPHFKGIQTKLTVAFSPETMDTRKQWDEIFKVLKGK